ncbi:MAG: OmpA family protein [Azoarcus sp.]|jgi:NitT/TauT family transport system substrate-binding protein|nr:OmpA family protein [Azoarcus sp.]
MTTNKPFTLPGFPSNWTIGLQLIVALLIVGVLGAGIFAGYPAIQKTLDTASASDSLRGGMNNFTGFAPGIWMNGGAKPNKDSRMTREFGVELEVIVQDDMNKLISSLKSGDLDFIFTTTDISPISMEEGGDLASMTVQQFLKIDDSRGADVFIVNREIQSVQQLKGKKIAVALGFPSNTLLHATLEAGGLTEKDVTLLTFPDPIAAKNAYISGNADATVVWSPDDIACLEARPSKVLTSTALMPNIIMDGFVARKDVLEKKKDLFIALSKAWLTANAEMQHPAQLAEAAAVYKVAFEVSDSVKDIIQGMKLIHFATYGDNINFFGLSTDFTGITGQALYNKMARVYKNGYGNNLKTIVPWNLASNPSIVQAITGLTGDAHAPEKQAEFTPLASTAAEVEKPALATKSVSVNFSLNSALLSETERDKIRREVGATALELAGFRIRVEGNTDSTGNRESNIALSKKRARAVADYLVKEYQFDPNRFIVVGNGPDKPVAANDTEIGRARNRRTDFEFIEN